ncbi:MAG TPA: hypothetical protein PLW75_02275 [Hyphomicrobium sp.]|nr:hypothetical protein [Hyphomicrobium sp.]
MTEFYRCGRWAVTSDRVETPRKDFDTRSITAVEVSRMPFWSACGLAAGATLATLLLHHILYLSEIAGVLLASGLGVYAASQVGTMQVSGSSWRGTETGYVWGPLWRLEAMRAAIREAQAGARDGIRRDLHEGR